MGGELGFTTPPSAGWIASGMQPQHAHASQRAALPLGGCRPGAMPGQGRAGPASLLSLQLRTAVCEAPQNRCFLFTPHGCLRLTTLMFETYFGVAARPHSLWNKAGFVRASHLQLHLTPCERGECLGSVSLPPRDSAHPLPPVHRPSDSSGNAW